MHKTLKYLVLFMLFTLLVLVRAFEEQLFYDPYLLFFQNDYLYIDSPRREIAKLLAFTTLRYTINTTLSIAILYVVFKDASVVKFSSLLYAVAFVGLMLLYSYFVINPKQEDYYMFFNVRRFLIQPIFLILLLPAFYYNKLKKRT